MHIVKPDAAPLEPIKLEAAEYFKLRMLTADIAVVKEQAMQEAQQKVSAAVAKRDAYVAELGSRYPGLKHGRFDTNDETCELTPV